MRRPSSKREVLLSSHLGASERRTGKGRQRNQCRPNKLTRRALHRGSKPIRCKALPLASLRTSTQPSMRLHPRTRARSHASSHPAGAILLPRNSGRVSALKI